MGILLKFKIWRLKVRARNAWEQLELIQSVYDCSHTLLMQIPRYNQIYHKYTASVAQLKKLDPNFPKNKG